MHSWLSTWYEQAPSSSLVEMSIACACLLQFGAKPMTVQGFKTKKDFVTDILRDAILSGEFQPGERLMQDELAERLNVSATPIREALRQLVAEGVLRHSPHKGVQVAEVNQADVRGVYVIRSALESLATRLAVPQLNPADVEHLRGLQSQMESLSESGRLKEMRKPNYEFHMRIYDAAGVPQLQQIIRGLWTQFPWDTLHVLPGRAAASVQEHASIIDDIENDQPERAGQHMQEHIENGAKALTEYLMRTQEN
jgi:DNA-binding GntR family transcriptional regulator